MKRRFEGLYACTLRRVLGISAFRTETLKQNQNLGLGSLMRSVSICWIFWPSAPQSPDFTTGYTEEDLGLGASGARGFKGLGTLY